MLIVLKSGSLNLLEPSGLVQACNGIALPSLCQVLQISKNLCRITGKITSTVKRNHMYQFHFCFHVHLGDNHIIPRTSQLIFLFYHLVHFTPSVQIINWPSVQKSCQYLTYGNHHDNKDCNYIIQHYKHDIYSTKKDPNGKISAISEQPSVLQSTISPTFSVAIIRVTGKLNMMQMVAHADFTAFICPYAKMSPHAMLYLKLFNAYFV